MSPHAIGVADAYVAAVQAEREGELRILDDRVETEGTVTVDSVQVIPDLFLHIHITERGQDGRLFVEVDTGTESRQKIEDKLKRYYYLFKHWHEQSFPIVVFLATNPDKLEALKRKVDQAPPQARPMFRVYTLESFPQVLWTGV